MRLRVLTLAAVVTLAATASAVPAAATSTSAEPLAPVCAEPVGQTDTPAHPRVERAVVGGVPVAVVLPPDYATTTRHYPVLYLLHGAQGDEDSWIEYGGLLETTGSVPEPQQAIVVLPRMGVVSGLAVDWVDGFRADATFVGRTLVDWTDRTFRTQASRGSRAVAGYSGGGLSAAHLAETFPDVFGQLGVLSGPLDPAGPENAAATALTMQAEKLCAGDGPLTAGPLGTPLTHPEAWAALDPPAHVDRLRSTRVWLSSGTGVPCSVRDAADLIYPTAATESKMRRQTDAFASALTAAGVEHTNQRRPCGLHWWSTWKPDLRTMWTEISPDWVRAAG